LGGSSMLTSTTLKERDTARQMLKTTKRHHWRLGAVETVGSDEGRNTCVIDIYLLLS
jgi:hypothetical protein